MRLLVTDDDPNLMTLYRTLFARRPELEVDYAASPSACRSCLASHRYDLALLDISLGDPAEDGIGLLRWVRATRPETGVMMMSTADSPEVVAHCLSLGAQSFTSKNRDFPRRLCEGVSSYARGRPPAAAASAS